MWGGGGRAAAGAVWAEGADLAIARQTASCRLGPWRVPVGRRGGGCGRGGGGRDGRWLASARSRRRWFGSGRRRRRWWLLRRHGGGAFRRLGRRPIAGRLVGGGRLRGCLRGSARLEHHRDHLGSRLIGGTVGPAIIKKRHTTHARRLNRPASWYPGTSDLVGQLGAAGVSVQ